MKIKMICLFVLMCCMQQHIFSQTITLTVDKNCKTFIALDDKTLLNDHVYDLQIHKGQSLQFQFINSSKKKALITIKGVGDKTKLNIENLPELFGKVNPITTDNNLNFSIDNKKYNLKEPFMVSIGCNDGSGAPASVTFNPGNTSNIAVNPPVGIATPPSEINKNDDQNEGGEQEYMPGSAVYDALKLADNKSLSEYEYKKIIKFYFPADTIDDINKAMLAAQKNPFLKMIIDSSYKPLKQTDKNVAESGNEILSNLSLSSIGGLDVTSFADGLAKFLVKRTKEELSIAFFKRLKNTIDSTPDLQTLFPATANLLSSIGTDVYDFQKYIQNLRESFKTDIQTLDENLPGIIDNHPALFVKYHALAASLRSGCYLVGELKKQVHPGDILANYPIEFLDKESKNWPGAIQTVQLLSASLRDTTSTDSTYWINIKYLRQLVNDKKALQIYFGLLYQKALNDYDSVQFGNASLVKILDEFALHYKESNEYFKSYKLYIMRFGEKTDALNKMIKNYTKPANDSLALELYKKYFDASIDMIEYSTQVGQLPFINKLKFLEHLHDTLAVYFNIAQATSDLVIDINRKNYSSAINHATYIYGEVRTKPSQIEAMAMQVTEVRNGNSLTDEQKKANKKAVDSSSKAETALNKFVKYGGFMASVATAKTSDDVEHAIEAFALPTGSSSVKRETAFNVALNAYVGVFAGYEKIKGIDGNKFKFNSFGITAPVGISASKGHSILFINSKWGCSSSIFISLIDVGTVAAYRFNGDTTVEKVPTIQLKDIVSPGIFYSHGFGKTPLSLNVGWQMGPRLRKVTPEANKFIDDKYSRFSISLCVDIPVLNFYTKSN